MKNHLCKNSTVNKALISILKEIRSNGGIGYLVGGYVRDTILNIKNEDIDVEVYGLELNNIYNILSKYGRVDAVGKSFGVFKATINGMSYDFSIPRSESKKGVGHKGFNINGDPFMSTLDASSRRDFTMNAIMIDPLDDNKIIDHHNGLFHIKNNVLRYVSEAFSDDPLRPLRAMQFSARFNLNACEDTLNVCKNMISAYKEISKERIWNEWKKWSLSDFPEKGIDFLDKSNWISLYPEIDNLKGCPQSPEWHPEGDVFIHTNLCLKEAARIANERNYNEKDRMILVFSILCHDFGKPETTKVIDGKIRALAHAQEGVKYAKSFLKSINAPKWLIENVLPLVDKHIHHAGVKTPNKRNVRRLINSLAPSSMELWDAVVEADKSGRHPLPKGKLDKVWLDIANELKEEMEDDKNKIKPILTGKHLVELGVKPSPLVGEILDKAYEHQLDNGSDENDMLLWLNETGYIEKSKIYGETNKNVKRG